ncbi:MAG: efflux RND transporter periplasmic adaptor subunit [Opitutales bacterium]|nr:efflux RND transporter periplasmic adaptor subunit [Opitutales bacterium]
MTSKKKLILIPAAVLVVAVLAYALRPAPVPATVVRVERGPFTEYVEEEGYTTLRNPYVVSAPVAGYLRRVTLEEGDTVGVEDLLFELEPSPAPALDARSLEEARARVNAAQARLHAVEAEAEARELERQYAEKEYERTESLYRRDAVPASQLELWRDRRDRARTAERAARNSVEVARFEVAQARSSIDVSQGRRVDAEDDIIRVRSPLDGVVLARHRRDEGPVQSGESVLEIGDLSFLEVRVDLLSMDAVRVRPGMEVILSRWGGGRDLAATVRRVDPAGFERISALGVEEQRVPVRIDFAEDRAEWERLGTGYRVEARFILWHEDDALQIPAGALFHKDGKPSVFVVEDNRARLRKVETDRRSGIRLRVVSGLDENETVIAHPADRIEDGTRVSPEMRDFRSRRMGSVPP